MKGADELFSARNKIRHIIFIHFIEVIDHGLNEFLRWIFDTKIHKDLHPIGNISGLKLFWRDFSFEVLRNKLDASLKEV